jgi:hypothetical protein
MQNSTGSHLNNPNAIHIPTLSTKDYISSVYKAPPPTQKKEQTFLQL